MSRRLLHYGLALGSIVALVPTAAAASVVFQNSIAIPGDAVDLAPGSSPNETRFGAFSDIYYDRFTNSFYALGDRGPGGGVISYETRVQQFSLGVNQTTGAISNFQLQQTIKFSNGGAALNGLNPQLLNGNVATLGNSHDPEGFAIGKNGNFFVADEYGPAVREFTPSGQLVRTFTTPANLLPKKADTTLDFVSGRPTIVTGRQDNRGYEGLAISADGSKLYAMLQDPLVNEGSSNEGRRSQNLRLVEFDVASGTATKQFIYQLESIADINSRIPGTGSDFGATAQGRNIGISGIVAIDENRFLVIERDNRGVGVDDPLGLNPVGSKRVYEIDISGATDVSALSLEGTNTLPPGVAPVAKSLHLDVQAALLAAGLPLTEKLEGIAIGPMLDDGSFLLLLGIDNDFSVTQSGEGVQFDVCVGGGASSQVAIGDACPDGQALLPSYLYAFKDGNITGYVTQQRVPEPATWTLMLAATLMLAGCGIAGRRGN